MADSRAYKTVECEIREKLPTVDFFKERNLTNFSEKNLTLSSGGQFKFDAVDETNTAAVNISASKGVTLTTGKPQSATKRKVFADAHFLLQANVDVRAIVFAQKTAYDVFEKEQKNGRIPENIKLLHIPVSAELQKRLDEAGKKSSDEVNPQKQRINP